MKRILLFTLVIGLFAVQANADMWELDRPTALQFTNIAGVDADDSVGTLSVYDGPDATFYPTMSGQVGFVASMTDTAGADGFVVTAKIDAGGDAGLTSDGVAYDGITSYFQNDNDDLWSFELFYVDAAGEHSSGFVTLAGNGGATYLTVNDPDGLDLDDITNIGFRVQGNMTSSGGNPSQDDSFHVSLVPIPGAVLLGILGLGAVGIKLRKFA